MVLAPVVALVSSAIAPERDIWAHLWATRLPGMLVATAVLVTVVTVAAASLGTSLAWLVAAHRFRGRGLLVWLLALPLAIPAYVSGFVVLDTFDRSGPVRSWWGDVAGAGAWYPEVRSIAFAAVVLTLALYPYVYLLALGAFRDQAAGVVDAARTLGCSRGEAFRRVALPAARPAIIAGSVLVALEVLTDVGTVRLFNVQTLTDGIFRVWFDLGQREGATELAGLLLLAAVAILLAERRAGRRRGAGGADRGADDGRRLVATPAGAPARLGVSGAWLIVVAALVFPLVRLSLWAAEAVDRGRTASVAGGVGHHLGSSLAVTGATLAVCVVLGVLVALAARWVPSRRQQALTSATTLGYGLPGPVIALGVLVCLAAIDRTGILPRGVLLVGSFAGLIAALVVRYLALAVKPAQDSIGRVSQLRRGRSTWARGVDRSGRRAHPAAPGPLRDARRCSAGRARRHQGAPGHAAAPPVRHRHVADLGLAGVERFALGRGRAALVDPRRRRCGTDRGAGVDDDAGPLDRPVTAG